MNILSKIFGSFCGLFIMVSCETSAPIMVDTSCKNFLSNEWVSFSIKTSYYENGEFQYDRYNSTIIIHNGHDTALREIISIDDDGSITRMTSQDIIYINRNYMEVGRYEQENKFYDELAMDVLQGPMEYFQMYYKTHNSDLISYSDNATEFEVVDDDTLYTVPAIKTEKYCYSNGTCKLVDASIELTYDSKIKGFVLAKHTVSQWPVRREYVSSITDIKYDDCTRLVDSMFRFDSETYKNYDFVCNDTFLPHRYMTNNTEANESVLLHPLVNLSTEDTIKLGELNGTTLLCMFNFSLKEDTYQTIERAAVNSTIDNVVWLMPASNNTSKLTEMVARNHMGKNVYYTKGFNTELSEFYKYYILDENHHVLSYNNGDNVDKWINKTLRK